MTGRVRVRQAAGVCMDASGRFFLLKGQGGRADRWGMDTTVRDELFRKMNALDEEFAKLLDNTFGTRDGRSKVRYQPHKWTLPIRLAWDRVEKAQAAWKAECNRLGVE